MSEGYVKIADLKTLREGVGTSLRVEGVEIAVFRTGDEVYVIENLCPHQHIPVLAEGQLEGSILTCPMHGWQFDVVTGSCVHASGSVRTYPVRIIDGEVFITLAEEENPSWW